MVRYLAAGAERAAVGLLDHGRVLPLADVESTASLWALPLDELRVRLARALVDAGPGVALAEVTLLAPVDGLTEVWAAGVTYRTSRDARMEESDRAADVYQQVYDAARPELFFKSTAWRVSGDGEPIAIRSDSTVDVPEPELALVVNRYAEIVGYTICNDVSSRSIEGENPLYLPQAKVYLGGCALGPGVVPAWEVPDPLRLTIEMTITRAGRGVWSGSTSTSRLHRRFDDLLDHLTRADVFPDGVVLSTGTSLVPPLSQPLAAGDTVTISIEGIGTLTNQVVRGLDDLLAASDAPASGRLISCVAVRSRTSAYRSRTCGVGVSSTFSASGIDHAGGSSPPASTQAAWRAAPRATYSPGGGTVTGSPRTDGRDPAYGLRPRSSPDQDQPVDRRTLPLDRGHAVGQAAEHPLDRRPGQVRRGRRAQPQAVHGAGGVRAVGGALALEVGHQDQPVRAGGCGQGEAGQLVVVDTQDPRGGIEDPGGVEGRDQRQEPAGRVGKAGHGAGRVLHRPLGDRARDPRRTDRDDDVAGPGLEAQRGRGVVAASRAEHLPGGGPSGFLGRPQHPGLDRASAEGELEQVVAVAAPGRRPVAGAARVTTVGDQGVERGRSGEAPGEVVVGQADRGGARRVVGLVVGQPAQLGHRERGDRHRPDRLRPRRRAVAVAAQLGDQVGGRAAGPGVVPQQRGAYDGAVLVQADHAVLLPAHRDRGDVVEAAGRGRGLLEGVPPGLRVDLGAVGVRGAPRADDLSRLGIADEDLAGLGRGVDSGNERHVHNLPSCAAGGWRPVSRWRRSAFAAAASPGQAYERAGRGPESGTPG